MLIAVSGTSISPIIQHSIKSQMWVPLPDLARHPEKKLSLTYLCWPKCIIVFTEKLSYFYKHPNSYNYHFRLFKTLIIVTNSCYNISYSKLDCGGYNKSFYEVNLVATFVLTLNRMQYTEILPLNFT